MKKSREPSTDRGFLCYAYRSIRPALSVFHAHKYDSTSYTCRSSSYLSAWLYSDASDQSPFSLYSLIPDRNYLFMKIHPFFRFVKHFLNFQALFFYLLFFDFTVSICSQTVILQSHSFVRNAPAPVFAQLLLFLRSGVPAFLHGCGAHFPPASPASGCALSRARGCDPACGSQ